MSPEQRIADLERAVAMLVTVLGQTESPHYSFAAQGGRVRFVFSPRYDGGCDVEFEPAND